MEEKNSEAPVLISPKRAPEGINMSRRKFLKIATGAAAAAVLPKWFERIVYWGASKGLTTPGVTDEIISSSLKVSEGSPNSENPNYRPITEVIEEAVSNYANNTGKSVVYKRDAAYRDKFYYAEEIEKIADASLLPALPSEAIHQLTRKFPSDAFFAYVSSDTTFGQFADLMASGSGFNARFRQNHPELFYGDGRIKDYDNYFLNANKDLQTEIIDTQKSIEAISTRNNSPVSASIVLEHFLGKNDGDLALTVYDTALFLKFMARNDPETGGGTSEFNEIWMKANIRDEYQGPSYINPPSGERLINLVGKPYHSWNLVTMLQFFPTELIEVGGVYRQAITFRDQGLGKTRSDLQTLNNLREVEKLLLSYSKK